MIEGKKSCQNYATLERAIETLDVYAPLPSDDIQQADRFERHRWLEDIQLPFPIMKWSYSMENRLGNLTFLWIIPEDPKTRSQSEDISILRELEASQHSPPGRPVHPPYSSVFVTEFNPEYGNTDLLIWLRKRSSPKYGNAHHLNIFLR